MKVMPTDKSEGLVYVFTGDGKGKTSAAIGVCVRAVGVGMKVGWVGFYKQESWGLSEMKPLESLGVKMVLVGKGFYIKNQKSSNKIKVEKLKGGGRVVDRASEKEHMTTAIRAIAKARELLDRVDLLVLDEVNNAVEDGLVEVEEVRKLLESRGKVHLVLTGRGRLAEVVGMADLVTEMRKVKHPYDQGQKAVRGLDF